MRRFLNIQPLLILLLQFALGVSASNYLGNRFDGQAIIIGLVWLLLVYAGSRIMAAPFHPEFDLNSRRFPEPFRHKPQAFMIMIGAFVFLLAITLSVFQIDLVKNAVPLIVMEVLIFFYFLFENVPPLAIRKTAFSELGFSVVYGALIPFLAFFLQAGEIHRILAMVSFPSVFLLFSLQIILGLVFFIPDHKEGIKSFLHSVGWENGIFWQNISILTAYLLLAVAVYFQLAFPLAWPVFLTLILAVYQIMQLRRIQQGVKPNWNTLVFTTFLVYFSFVYLLFFGMILR